MDELGGNLAGEATEMFSGSVVHPTEELRKRRSTRIVQAVPLMVTGVDALGRPFTERTSSLIINCHGCRYQSKHYVLKNMWVTLEVPHPEAGKPARNVRGRVAWIQRPRTVRQLFQVALELESAGNVWGIAFPPEDWFSYSEAAPAPGAAQDAAEPTQLQGGTEIHLPLNEPEPPGAGAADNLRVFPSPVSATDASLQLARHVARLLADAKQQLQAATHEAAAQAVSAERRISANEWEQKLAAAREELAREVSRAVQKIEEETGALSQRAYEAAEKTAQSELPSWVAPQLELLAQQLTQEISSRTATQHDEIGQRLASAADSLSELCKRAEETAKGLHEQAQQAVSRIAERAEAAQRAIEEEARQREAATATQREALSAAAGEIHQQLASTLASAQGSWQSQLSGEFEAARNNWQASLEGMLAESRGRATEGLNEQARTVHGQMLEEIERQRAAQREEAAAIARESDEKLAHLREALQGQTDRIEGTLGRASEAIEKLEHFSARIDTSQQQALTGFQSQLDDVLSLHRNELHRRSDALFEEINARIRGTFEESSRQAAAQFEQQITALMEPHLSQAQDAMQRLAGGRSLLDAALTMQQDRIRVTADEAFAESLGKFRENLGSAEQLLQETSRAVAGRNLEELESRVGDLKQRAVDDLSKSAEWFEKKAQTQIQGHADKAIDQVAMLLREKAGEISSVFASELDHSSRSFMGHAQTQIGELVRDSFERSRALFAEAAETTAAAFTDEIQRTARQELAGFGEEVQRSAGEMNSQLEVARREHAQKLTAEQEEFLRRFHGGMSNAMESGVTSAYQRVERGLAQVFDSWKSMTEAHQDELRSVYARIGEQSSEQHRNKLENVSNQWLLATVASLDHQSRDVVAGISATAEERLRETCMQVFTEIGETLRERLKEIAADFTRAVEGPARARGATPGS
jgi:hypothetical protein